MAGDYGKLMLSYFQAIVLSRQDLPKYKRKQFYKFVDEMAVYGGGNIIGEMAAESRKFGLGLRTSTQIVGQNMSTEQTELLMANSTLKVVAKNSDKSLRAMSKNIGIDMDTLNEIPNYAFYLHNKDFR